MIGKLMEGNGDKYGFSVSHTTRGPRPGEVRAREMVIKVLPSISRLCS